jgi:hypothetical protein
MTSYHVRFWDIRKISDTTRGRYRVRWAVDGREHCKSFTTKALADASWAPLKDAPATARRSTRPPGSPPLPHPPSPGTSTPALTAR